VPDAVSFLSGYREGVAAATAAVQGSVQAAEAAAAALASDAAEAAVSKMGGANGAGSEAQVPSLALLGSWASAATAAAPATLSAAAAFAAAAAAESADSAAAIAAAARAHALVAACPLLSYGSLLSLVLLYAAFFLFGRVARIWFVALTTILSYWMVGKALKRARRRGLSDEAEAAVMATVVRLGPENISFYLVVGVN